jgi:hypothetical protein
MPQKEAIHDSQHRLCNSQKEIKDTVFGGGINHVQAYAVIVLWTLNHRIMQLYPGKIVTKLVTEIFHI